MKPHYYKAKTKKNQHNKTSLGFALSGLSIVLVACLSFPQMTGKFGLQLSLMFQQFSGWASLLLPIYLGWLGFNLIFKKDPVIFGRSILFFVFFLFSSCLFSLFHTGSAHSPGGHGGWVGDQISLLLIHQFGAFLVFLIAISALFVSGSLLAGLSPLVLLHSFQEKIRLDIETWRSERKKMQEKTVLKKKLDQSIELQPLSPGNVPRPKPNIQTSDPTLLEDLGPRPLKLKSAAKPQMPASPVIAKNESKATLDSVNSRVMQADNGERYLSPVTAAPTINYELYQLPSPDLLQILPQNVQKLSKDELYANGNLLEKTLEQFSVKAKVIDIHPGPVITRYDLTPDPGVRVQSIEGLSNDIALAMKARSLRVLAPVPGKAAVGIEISNPNPVTVFLKEIVQSANFQNNKKELPFGMGKTTEGEVLVSDLASMPHLLIAGATGSGKSVGIHALILSILFRFRPDEVKLVLIDPKRLELPVYDGIPHLYDPAVPAEEVKAITQPKLVVLTLKKLVEVMEDRYKNFAKLSVRNIQGYNERAPSKNLPKVPYVVVVIDELADLMVVAGKEIEDLIQRLAQMARAVGIHLVLATQRPSVDVITGVIKANLPSRVAFQVLSRTDSRVILDSQGAESLLGRGDMLFLATSAPKPVRAQAAFVSEQDVSDVVQFIKNQNFKPDYQIIQPEGMGNSVVDNEDNYELMVRAAQVVLDAEKVSGDLLRADKEIGSKYDLALSLLKKRGFIEKPRDTNRWKIYFDKLEEFLAQAKR